MTVGKGGSAGVPGLRDGQSRLKIVLQHGLALLPLAQVQGQQQYGQRRFAARQNKILKGGGCHHEGTQHDKEYPGCRFQIPPQLFIHGSYLPYRLRYPLPGAQLRYFAHYNKSPPDVQSLFRFSYGKKRFFPGPEKSKKEGVHF